MMNSGLRRLLSGAVALMLLAFALLALVALFSIRHPATPRQQQPAL